MPTGKKARPHAKSTPRKSTSSDEEILDSIAADQGVLTPQPTPSPKKRKAATQSRRSSKKKKAPPQQSADYEARLARAEKDRQLDQVIREDEERREAEETALRKAVADDLALAIRQNEESVAYRKRAAENNAARKAAAEKEASEKAIAAKVAAEEAAVAEKLAADKLEAEKAAAVKEAQERAAAIKAAAEKLAADKAEAERLQKEKEEREKAAAEKLAADKAEAERLQKEKEEREKEAAEKLAAEKLAAEKEAAEKEAERIRKEKEAREKAAAVKLARCGTCNRTFTPTSTRKKACENCYYISMSRRGGAISLNRRTLTADDIARLCHPLGGFVEPAFKQFRGSDQVTRVYTQMRHAAWCSTAFVYPGIDRCYLPAITFAAGTSTVCSSAFKELQANVRLVDLKKHVATRGYVLEIAKNASDRLAFFRNRTGCWIATCAIGSNKATHYIAYDAWRGVIYEPFNNELIQLEATDLESKFTIKNVLDTLEIKHFTGFAQLWRL